MSRCLSLLALMPLWIALPTGAQAQTRAGDGSTELSQELAIAGNITSGDSAGFPISIHRSGVFRLSSNLVVPAGLDAIVIQPGVEATIDLNGFQIVGPAVCALHTHCTQYPGTAGVRSASESSSLTVRNGRIRGFSDAGISGRSGSAGTAVGHVVAEDLRLWNNASGLIAKQLFASRLSIKGNSAYGLMADHGLVRHSLAQANVTGIYVRRGRVSDSIALDNTSAGFVGGSNVLLHFNNASGNGVNVINGVVATPNLF